MTSIGVTKLALWVNNVTNDVRIYTECVRNGIV